MANYKLSALVSCYSSHRFIRKCLEDLMAQTLYQSGGLEIVVIDSNSPQDERQVIYELQRDYPHIVYHRTSERETLYGAWNTGINIARGEFLTNANTDDRHHAQAFEILTKQLDANASIELNYADCAWTEHENTPFAEHDPLKLYKYKPFFAPEVCLHFQFGPQPVWRRTVHDRIGGFDSQYKAAGDWEFNFRFNLAGLRAAYVEQTLGLFLNHSASVSRTDSSSVNEQTKLRQQMITFENICALYRCEGYKADSNLEKAAILNNFALRAAHFTMPWEPQGAFSDFNMAISCLTEAASLAPQNHEFVNNLACIYAMQGNQREGLNILAAVASKDVRLQSNLTAIQKGDLSGLQFLS